MTTCPLCSSPPTQFAHPLSESCDLNFEDQQCSNHACELPCKFWLMVQRWREADPEREVTFQGRVLSAGPTSTKGD